MPVEANIGILSPVAISNNDTFSVEPIKKVDWYDAMPESPELYWRFHAYVDFWGADPAASITASPWFVLRRTPKGAWVSPYKSDERLKRFVLDGARKRLAYPTKQEAWDSFLVRLRFREQYWDTEGQRIAAIKALVAQENG